MLDGFVKALREAVEAQKPNIPKLEDLKPLVQASQGSSSSLGGGKVDTPTNLPNMAKPSPLLEVGPYGDEQEPAYNSSLFVGDDRFGGKVTPEQYDNFVNNRFNFDRMLLDWLVEDDPRKRTEIINKYSDKYGFRDNLILNDLIANGIGWFDYGDANDHASPGAKFDIIGRMDWLNALKENMDYAEKHYSPYRTV